MSWTAQVSGTKSEVLGKLYDTYPPQDEYTSLNDVKYVVEQAQEAAEFLVREITRPKITVTLSGHTLAGDQAGDNFYEGITVTVSGSK